MDRNEELETDAWYLMKNGRRKRVLWYDDRVSWQGDLFLEDTGCCSLRSFREQVLRKLASDESPQVPTRSVWDMRT